MLAARLWIDLKHLNMQSLGQRHQEAEPHSKLLFYLVWQDQLVELSVRLTERPLALLPLFVYFLHELDLFVLQPRSESVLPKMSLALQSKPSADPDTPVGITLPHMMILKDCREPARVTQWRVNF